MFHSQHVSQTVVWSWGASEKSPHCSAPLPHFLWCQAPVQMGKLLPGSVTDLLRSFLSTHDLPPHCLLGSLPDGESQATQRIWDELHTQFRAPPPSSHPWPSEVCLGSRPCVVGNKAGLCPTRRWCWERKLSLLLTKKIQPLDPVALSPDPFIAKRHEGSRCGGLGDNPANHSQEPAELEDWSHSLCWIWK